MNKKKLAERILGAVLVCSFGFILYSAFLDTEGTVFVDRNTQIPPQARFIEPLEIEEKEVELARPKPVQEVFIPTKEVRPEEALEAPVLENGVANAWVIQVGSFSSLEKADEIRDSLIADDYRAYHRKLDTEDDRQLFRVLVGPYMNAEEAVQHQRAVDAMLDISTLLMKFEP